MYPSFKKILFITSCIFCFVRATQCQDLGEKKNVEIIEFTVGCLASGGITNNYVIKNQAEYEELLNHINPYAQQCSDYSLPAINFNQYSLLGFKTADSGCKRPEYKRTVEYNESENTYTYTVEVTTVGLCRPLFSKFNFILIPKIQEDSKVIFIKNVTNVKEEYQDE